MRQVGDESILPSVVALWDQTEPVDVQVSLPGRREGAQHAAFSKLTTDILRDKCWLECGGVHVAGGRCKGSVLVKTHPEAFLEALTNILNICPVRVCNQRHFPAVWVERS